MSFFTRHAEQIITAMIIVFGALVHATVQLKIARDNEDTNFSKVDFLILIPIAMFSGMIFAFVGDIFFNDPAIVNLCASAGAFLGIAGLNTVSNTILKVLISKVDSNDSKK